MNTPTGHPWNVWVRALDPPLAHPCRQKKVSSHIISPTQIIGLSDVPEVFSYLSKKTEVQSGTQELSSAEKNQWIHHVDDHNQQNQKTTLYVFYWISWVKKATSFCWNMNKSWNSNVNTKLLGRHIAAKQIERTHIPKAHLQNCMIFKKRVWQSHQTYLCPSMTIWLLHFNMRTEKQHIERNNFNRNYDTYTVY